MYNISDVDRNFVISTGMKRDDIRFFDARNDPFRLYGLMFENGRFCRMTNSAAKNVSDAVFRLNRNTAGGRVRFVTDSEYVAISAKMDNIGRMSHFSLTGSAGFDLLYSKDSNGDLLYKKAFVPPYDMKDGYESVIDFDSRKKRVVEINFPLYSDLISLNIGLCADCVLEKAPDYKIDKPVVYYGSSITQGACASSPGKTYQSIISVMLDCDYLNLGFSGSAKGEQAMADYIKNLEMSALVLDYDYNAPTIQDLTETHEKMFITIRKAQPDLPIVILSRPKCLLNEEDICRFNVIKKTYDNAVCFGDKNVYLLSGSYLMNDLTGNEGLVDDIHPTDVGFMSIARNLGNLLKEIILK